MKNIMNKKIYMVFILFLLSLISSSALGYVFMKTDDRITLEYRKDFILALDIVLPTYYNDPYNDILIVDNRSVYLAKDHDSKVIAYAVLSTSDKGYSGKVSVIVGVDTFGKILGVYVLKHAETPGLGSNIEKPSFLEKYVGLMDINDIKIKRDGGKIETITGATISPRAVSLAVIDAVQFIRSKIIKEGGL